MKDHIHDGDLLRALDGELPKNRRALVEEHLAACWICRTRMHDLEGTIDEFVHVHFDGLKDSIPEIDGPRALLRARLHALESESERGFWSAPIRGLAAWKVPAFAVGVVILVSVFVFTVQRHSHNDEVTEVLRRAELSERISFESKIQPVTYQKLRIEIGGRRYERAVYLDKRHSRSVVSLSAVEGRKESPKTASADLSHLQQAFAKTSLDWTEPLSASRMAGWQATLRERTERIQRGPRATELTTETSEGPIAKAQIWFRNKDFHPISETLQLRNNDVVEIAELDYQVFELAELRKDLFEHSPTGNVVASVPVLAASSMPEPTVALELKVVQSLDRVNAFLGEQITVERQAGRLAVRGVVDDSARRQEILNALGPDVSNPALKIAIVTPPVMAVRSGSEGAILVENIEDLQKAPADERLRAFFEAKRGKSADVEEEAKRFAADVSMHSQAARSQALALRQIAELFSPKDLAEMTSTEHRRWRSLLQEHANAVLSETRAMRESLEPVFRTNVEDKRPLVPQVANDADLVYAATKLSEMTASNDSAVWHSFAASTEASRVTLVCLPEFWDSLLDAEVLAQEISAGALEEH